MTYNKSYSIISDMHEQLRGGEALRKLDFSQVVLPYNKALDQLTKVTRGAINSNVEKYLKKVGRNRNGHVERLLQNIGEGGFGFDGRTLALLYDNALQNRFTYMNVAQYTVDEIIPAFWGNCRTKYGKDANVATGSVGYLLDLLQILNPQIALFDDGVGVIVEAIRAGSGGISFLLLGSMIDDAEHLRGTKDLPFNPIMSVDMAVRLRDSLRRHLPPNELASFNKGYSVKYGDLFLKLFGRSVN